MNSCLLLTVSIALFRLSWASPTLHEEEFFMNRIELMSSKTKWILANHDEKCPEGEVSAASIICNSAEDPPCHIMVRCMTILKPRYIIYDNGLPRICSDRKHVVWDEPSCHIMEYTVQCRYTLQCMWTKREVPDDDTALFEKDNIEYDYPDFYSVGLKCHRDTEYVVWMDGGMDTCTYHDVYATCNYTYMCVKKDHTPGVIGISVVDPEDPKPICKTGKIAVKVSLCTKAHRDAADCRIHWKCVA